MFRDADREFRQIGSTAWSNPVWISTADQACFTKPCLNNTIEVPYPELNRHSV